MFLNSAGWLVVLVLLTAGWFGGVF